MGIHIFVVTTLHGTDVLNLGQETPATMSYILHNSDVVTAVSYDLANKTKQLYNFKKEVQVIYNFFDFQQSILLKGNHIKRNKFALADEKILVHISNFRPIKKINDTLKVFLKFHSQTPSVLLLIGEGPDFESAKKLAKTMKKQESIHFIGRVKNPYKYLAIADALLVTSSYESFCLVALEAISSGIPVFGTNVGGIPEVIEHGKSGYLVNVGDVNGMATNITQHFSNEKNIVQMKKQALKSAKKFTAKKIIPQYENIYKNLILAGKKTVKGKLSSKKQLFSFNKPLEESSAATYV
jgi:L-malate glycosyltransferase